MKASELIAALQKAIAEDGDLPVVFEWENFFQVDIDGEIMSQMVDESPLFVTRVYSHDHMDVIRLSVKDPYAGTEWRKNNPQVTEGVAPGPGPEFDKSWLSEKQKAEVAALEKYSSANYEALLNRVRAGEPGAIDELIPFVEGMFKSVRSCIDETYGQPTEKC